MLSAILRQNPQFRAGMVSPLARIYMALHRSMNEDSAWRKDLPIARRKRILSGQIKTYYADVSSDTVVFDTNRHWASWSTEMNDLFPGSKFVALVRPIPWVLNSYESLARNNPFDQPFLFPAGSNVETHIDIMMSPGGEIRGPYNTLQTLFYGPQAQNMMVIDYDSLTSDPEDTLRKLYDFLEEPYWPHEFSNLEFSADYFDGTRNLPGLHHVSGPVRREKRKFILPPDVFNRFQGMDFWRDQKWQDREIRIVAPTNHPLTETTSAQAFI